VIPGALRGAIGGCLVTARAFSLSPRARFDSEGSTDPYTRPRAQETTMDALDDEAWWTEAREDARLRRALDEDRWCSGADVGDALRLADAVAAVLIEVCRGV